MASTNNQTPIKDPTDTSIAEDMIFFLVNFDENFRRPNLFKLKRPKSIMFHRVNKMSTEIKMLN